MKIKAKLNSLMFDTDGNYIVSFSTKDKSAKDIIALTDKNLSLEWRKWRNPRSLEANAYAWVLIGEITEALNNEKGAQYTKDEVYIKLLKDYGNSVSLPIWENVIDIETAQYKFFVEKERTVLTDKNGNEQTFVWCECYWGSSEYDSREMFKFLLGVRDEALSMGIDVRTPKEIEEMSKAYRGNVRVEK